MKTICLNMIVKNESKIIERLLKSVCDIIDCYCICDTGSTDDTINIITSFFENKGIKGKVVTETFINFEHNRNVALKSCIGMSDYVLLMDADMILRTYPHSKEKLMRLLESNIDIFCLFQGTDDFYYMNRRIIKNKEEYSYTGVTHEYISSTEIVGEYRISKNDLFIDDIGDGGAKSDKYDRDIRLLTEDLDKNPTNSRSIFYLANSYFCIREYTKAIKYYRKRIVSGGWDQEIWYSYYRIGLCFSKMNEPEKAICEWLLAYDFKENRIENLYEIIKYYRLNGKYKLALQFYKMAVQKITGPEYMFEKDKFLFLHNDVYTHKLLFEYIVLAYYCGIKNIDSEIIDFLNNCSDKELRRCTFSNFKYYVTKLEPLRVIDLSISQTVNYLGHNTEFVSSSICMLPCNESNNLFDVNIRHVDYKYLDDGKTIYNGKRITTMNEYIKMNIDFDTGDNHLLDTKFLKNDEHIGTNFINGYEYNGIEDIRIFRDVSGELLFIGTKIEYGNINMSMGKYSTENDILEWNIITPTFEYNKQCEKNWSFVNYQNETNVIYKWQPLTICTFDESSISIKNQTHMPKIFNEIRGSTPGFNYNNEIWFIVHLTSNEYNRCYYHMIVVFDDGMELLRHSPLFTFEGEKVEFCLSMIVDDSKIIASYSTTDKTTKIGVYS